MGRKKIQISRITDERNRQVKPSRLLAKKHFIECRKRNSLLGMNRTNTTCVLKLSRLLAKKYFLECQKHSILQGMNRTGTIRVSKLASFIEYEVF